MPPIWRRVLLISLLVPLLMGSKADRWREVAESDIAFASDLAAHGIEFDTGFRDRLIKGKVAGCIPRASRIREVDQADRRLIGLYCLQVCSPWHQAWAEIFSACDRVWVPKWCKAGDDDLVVKHIKLGRYFETLTAAILQARTSLERSNIMEVIADRLNSEVLRHHPSTPIDGWVADALSAYLKTAAAEEVVGIAEPICGATFGHGDRVARQFVEYRDRPGFMTEDQKCAMRGILSRKDRWSCGAYSGGALEKTADEKAAERHALEASVLTPQNIALLSRRIDAFYRLEREGKCSESYEFLALDFRETGYEKEDWVRTCEHLRKGSAIVEWHVNRARALGNRIKVYTLVHYRNSGGSQKGQEWSRGWEIYWVFEDNTWNQGLGVEPEGWNDDQTIEVQLPSVPPGDGVHPKVDE